MKPNHKKLAADALESVERLEAELNAAKEQLEWDRTQCADFLTNLHKCMDSRFWLTEGRGSYTWDDDRYRAEFKEAASELLVALRPLREMAANLTSRLQTTAEVVQARIDLKKRISDLEAEREKLAKLVVMLRDHPLPDSLRDAFESAGAEEELRRLAAEWGNRGRKRRMLAQELVDRADEIKARREVAHEA